MYIIYIFLSLILLLNLLIALLGNTFRKTQEDAALHGRIALAQMVLRLEIFAEVFGINTSAGELDAISGKFVHQFRSVVRNEEGESMIERCGAIVDPPT